jgi:AraC family transcriptional regulator
MKPTLIDLPELTLIGFEAAFISALSPDANNFEVIPPLWRKLHTHAGAISLRSDSTAYGACLWRSPEQRTRYDELSYLAGFPVLSEAPVPAGMTRWTVPASTYAKFTHRGHIARLAETINAAHTAWLPRSDYTLASGPELEHYDERFGDGGEGSELAFLLPVRPRK